jgi:5-oxoprolinase (ATP-hydrolysing) subunit A
MPIELQMGINCDLGEGLGVDHLYMPYIQSCNIACGGHFGDQESIVKTLKLAKKYGVKAGAHPSYPDKYHFGRKVILISAEALEQSLFEQIFLFKECCLQLSIPMHHVKLHGALYNQAATDPQTATIICSLMSKKFPDIPLLGLPDSAIEEKARKFGVPFFREAFADRAYDIDGKLLSRLQPDALITDPELAFNQVYNIIYREKVAVSGGTWLKLKADTICVHGDNPNALEILKKIHSHAK